MIETLIRARRNRSWARPGAEVADAVWLAVVQASSMGGPRTGSGRAVRSSSSGRAEDTKKEVKGPKGSKMAKPPPPIPPPAPPLSPPQPAVKVYAPGPQLRLKGRMSAAPGASEAGRRSAFRTPSH